MLERHRAHEQTLVLPELTQAHWQLISSVRFKDPKINHYALAKAGGVIDEAQGPHIGRRHWHKIWSAAHRRTSGIKGMIAQRLRPDHFSLFQEVARFAEYAVEHHYTLNDYLTKLKPTISLEHDWGEPEELSWDAQVNTWQLYGDVYGNFQGGPELREYGGYLGDAEARFVTGMWLLPEDEATDVVHTPPEILMEKLWGEIKSDPEAVRERLKTQLPNLGNLHSDPMFGVIEKDIPSL